MSFTHRLTDQDIHSTDREGMAANIAAMGEHVREAIGLANAVLRMAELPQGIRSVVVAGMGGSAIGGDLIRSYLSGILAVPMVINRSYVLPPWTDEHTLVIASSYSGNTEETLTAFEEAVRRKLKLVCITTGGKLGARAKELGIPVISQKGGLAPRAALAYSFVPILLTLEKAGLVSEQSQQITHVAELLDTLSEKYGTGNLSESNPAFALAGQLMHRIPVIYSAVDYEAVCLRWRGQIQENAKHLAFGNLMPEMNHNELEGWAHPIDVTQHLSVILLRGGDDENVRVTKRFGIVKEILGGKQVPVVEVHAEGTTRLERMMSLVSLADWTSYYLALLAGTDPTPIPAMDLLKQRMG